MVDAYKPLDELDSVTESTFILMPQQKNGRSKGNTTTSAQRKKPMTASDSGYVQLLQGKEPTESMELRKQLFESTWNPLEKHLMDTEHKVNNAGIIEVSKFVDTAYTTIELKEKGQLSRPFAEIATAVTFAGVNTGDHTKLFESLQSQLTANGHYIALLESQYCTTLPNMLKSMLEQLYTSIHARLDLEAAQGLNTGATAKSIAYDMGLLHIWWNAIEARSSTGSRIVIILQDFEGFPPMVIDDFVRIATGYCHTVPIVLVFGLATSYECIHQSLTKSSISMLNVERFNLQRSKQCIDSAIYSLFVQSTSILTFGAEAYKSLMDQFLLYDFSITGFVKKLKYAIMDFFYSQPLSILAAMVKMESNDSCKHGVISEFPIRLTHDQIELIRMQKSVRLFLEQQLQKTKDQQRFRQAISSDEFFQEAVLPVMMRQLASYRQGYCLGIDMLLAIQSMSPESLQKPIRTLHYYGLSQTFSDCMNWKTLFAVMRRMKAPEMKQLLLKLQLSITNLGEIDWEFAAKDSLDIPALLLQASKLLEDPEESSKEDTEANSSEQKKRIRTRTDMESRPFLLFDNESSDQILRALDKCCGIVETILSACLQPYQTAPLYEIFYYRHSFLLDTTFSAQPRAAVQTALGRTEYYINCDCCTGKSQSKSNAADASIAGGDGHSSDESSDEDDGYRVMSSMHDTSIAYRLHQECGRLINLYDWYSAFSSVVEKEDERSCSASGQSEVQARFMRAVEEMRYLGFVKSTQRKTDHVVRLTWGA
ncbi:origin recognition complex subunit 3 N-terminus-domain-containing protein [Coemansia spiralis]|nr:origin recognition complex subunit 3 N-terminus-domain-containing protein [Coemansia spiralis]